MYPFSTHLSMVDDVVPCSTSINVVQDDISLPAPDSRILDNDLSALVQPQGKQAPSGSTFMCPLDPKYNCNGRVRSASEVCDKCAVRFVLQHMETNTHRHSLDQGSLYTRPPKHS